MQIPETIATQLLRGIIVSYCLTNTDYCFSVWSEQKQDSADMNVFDFILAYEKTSVFFSTLSVKPEIL